MRSIIVSILTIFLTTLVIGGCGSKKPKSKTADDTDAKAANEKDSTETDDEEEITKETKKEAPADKGDTSKTEPEQPQKGPAVFPPAPENNFSGRSPKEYLLSIKKAQIIPAKPDGECWDDCSGDAQTAVGAAMSKIGALPPTNQQGFDLASKALTGFIGNDESFPDVFVHIRCGHGQGHKTNLKSAKNKIVATWSYENKKFKLDDRDECVISIWDHDEDGDEEIGRTTVRLAEKAKQTGGKVVLYTANDGLGHVYSLELSLKPLSSSAGSSTSSGSSASSGSSTSGGNSAPGSGKTSYSIEIIKAQIKKTKDNGKPWDVKLGGGMLGGLAGKLGGVKADVYVEAWVNGYLTPKAAFTTSVKKENHYPKWDEGTSISLKATDHINFMLWDKDASQNDLIGECKTKAMGKQYTGEVWLKNCGQVDYLLVKITKN